VETNKICDGLLDFLSANTAHPAGREMFLHVLSGCLSKLAIDGAKEFLVRRVRFVMLHRIIFQR
jgi:hypothetical protein